MNLSDQLHPNWRDLLGEKIELLKSIEHNLANEISLPEPGNVLRALTYDPYLAKVLILGQDPYPNSVDAMGLAFSTARRDGKLPASLRNIFVELATDLNIKPPIAGDLSPWCQQGVVLLNRTLTCRNGESDSHRDIGWREFTYEVVKSLAELDCVAILWGNAAQEVSELFATNRLIKSAHPSPLSAYRGFFGSKPFSSANKALKESGREPIDWSLPAEK